MGKNRETLFLRNPSFQKVVTLNMLKPNVIQEQYVPKSDVDIKQIYSYVLPLCVYSTIGFVYHTHSQSRNRVCSPAFLNLRVVNPRVITNP